MRSITVIFIFFAICIACQNHAMSHHQTIEKNNFQEKDTLIPLNKNISLYFGSYNEEMKLWYNLYIVKNQKKIKLIKGNDYPGFGSELFYALSPNSKFLVLDGVIKDYVFESEKDSVLHENFKCSIIDLEKVKTVRELQQDCDGNWNDANQWISGGKVIFE